MFRIIRRFDYVPSTLTVVSTKYFEFVVDGIVLFTVHFSRDNKIKSEYRLKNTITEKITI